MKTILSLCALAFITWTCNGLTCWECQNQPTNDECLTKGIMKKCQPNQDSCQNEVRKEHGKVFITKRCKQAHACGNNFAQNEKVAWEPSQCNDLELSEVSLCRCCCKEDLCNEPEQFCIGGPQNPYPTVAPECKALKVPQHGSKTCSPMEMNMKASLETVCEFECNNGYLLVGMPTSTCLFGRNKRPEFDNPAPYCKPNPQCKRLRTPKYGSKTCSKNGLNGSPTGTVCSFKCDDGYILRGAPKSVCMKTVQPMRVYWTHKVPLCRPNPRCDPVGVPRFGRASCSRSVTGGTPPGAVCTFSCRRGYKLEGDEETRCVIGPKPTEAYYSKPVPTCVPDPKCSEIAAPENGGKKCSQDGELVDVGTVCEFNCDKDFELVGFTSSACLKGARANDAFFDKKTPTCEPRCRLPGTPENGKKECTQENRRVPPGTVCTYECNEAYILEGLERDECDIRLEPYRAIFDSEEEGLPRCRPDPKCDRIGEPENGQTTCTNPGDLVPPRTICSFRCDPGYFISDDRRSTCRVSPADETKAEFDNLVPQCLPDPKCDIIGTPGHGSKSCTSNRPRVDTGTVCRFDCNPGYILVGAQRSTCRVGAVPTVADFDNDVPICNPNPKCPPIGTPRFGSKSCSQTTRLVDPGTTCDFDCNPGYMLIGSTRSTCREGATPLESSYDNPVPICQPNPKCDLIGIPTNGTRQCVPQKTPKVDIGTLCSFDCNEGYILEGASVSLCTEGATPLDASFSNPVPNCKPNPKCDRIGIPRFGTRNCTPPLLRVLRADPETVCNFKCNPGYILRGDKISTCVEADNPLDSKFDNPIPVCMPDPMCTMIRTPRNGKKNCSENGEVVPAGTVCNFECDGGYVLEGSPVSTCNEALNPIDSSFDNPVPFCRPNPMCDLIGSPINGDKVCDQETPRVPPGTKCDFTCDEGYLLRGATRSTCRADPNPLDSVFDRPVPTCRSNPMCEIIGTPENGKKTCSEDGLVVPPETTCIFECDNGYILTGADMSTCQAAANPVDSAFDNEVPICKPDPMCDIIGIPEFGSKSCTPEEAPRVKPGTVCTFDCNKGYLLQGRPRSTCRKAPNPLKSAFDNPVPRCTANPMCELIGTPENGDKNCSVFDDVVPPGSFCEFTCEEGYVLDGDVRSTCEVTSVPTVAKFNRPVPRCRPNPMCELIGTPENGDKNCSVFDDVVPPGSFCEFTCEEGYVLDGDVRSTCEVTSVLTVAKFNRPVPRCRPNPMCEIIGTPENGDKSCSPREEDTVRPDTVCSFTCDPGYKLEGDNKSTCTVSDADETKADFDKPAPTCRPDPMCDIIGIPEFGSKSCTPEEAPRVKPGTVCTFDCNEGYLLQGSPRSTCHEAPNPLKSAFDNPVPRCTANPMCELIGTPENGDKNCSVFDDIVPPGSFCEFTCEKGYVLDGDVRSTCEVTSVPTVAKFNRPVPRCRPNPMCEIIGTPENGDKSCSPREEDIVRPDTVCSFTCDPGYELVGDNKSTCTVSDADETKAGFDKPVPTCRPDPMCDRIGIPRNGERTCQPTNLPQVPPDTVCSFTCNDGYSLVGSVRSTCREAANPLNSQFDEPVPRCTANPMCPIIRAPENGRRSCDQKGDLVPPGTQCSFGCDSGYVRVGPETSVCLVTDVETIAEFNRPVPICRPNPMCEIIGAPENGDKTCTQQRDLVLPDTICNFTCDDGYRLDGSIESVCLVTDVETEAEFNNPVPTCRPNPMCDIIGTPTNGDKTCTQDGDVVRPDTVCEFTCDRGYLLTGSEKSTCVVGPRPIDASFDNDVPVCTPNPKCNLIGTPVNGEKVCTPSEARVVDPGTVCNFGCNEGYVLQGEKISTCVEGRTPLDAAFDNPVPICRPLPECDALGNPINGVTTCTQTGATVDLDTVCTFTCNAGFTRTGPERSTCLPETPEQLTAKFDNPLPSCVAGECDELKPEPNAEIDCTDANNLNSVCTYICEEDRGFMLFPSDLSSTKCLPENATWSKPLPCCVPNCPMVYMDLVLVLDSSGSIGQTPWGLLLAFVERFIRGLDIGPDRTEVAIFTFSDDVDKRHAIELSDNKRSIIRRVRRLPWLAGETNTGAALRYTRQEVLRHDHSIRADPEYRSEVVDVTLLITDGQATDTVLPHARRLRSIADVYVVGVEPSVGFINRQELNAMAGDPRRVRFVDEGYAGLTEDFAMDLMALICGEPKCDREE
ncbi:sushi, von Willebrand factor type A, EGF and pentraxin domain-containing protein 1-like isoform X2 [Clavelina lepadiformis]|uniref:sushi, von Willebrand factor type A, EGF and pentraxin domain-containing protein 1-like isoform X2 n=1 Tax=Clavelina lepadiformis TaxID=159417 RepID=UPI0040412EC6